MTKAAELKTQACAEIDARRDDIIAIGESILRNPETGFREVKTEQLVARTLNDLDLETQTGLAITGVKAKIAGDSRRPKSAVWRTPTRTPHSNGKLGSYAKARKRNERHL